MLDLLEGVGVGDHAGHHVLVPRRGNGVTVKGDEGLAGLDLVVCLNVAGEALAVHVHGANADVDEHLDAVCRGDADGVVGHRGGANASVHGRVQHAVAHRHDAVAVTQKAGGEHLVVDLLEADQHAGDRRVDHVVPRGKGRRDRRLPVTRPRGERALDLVQQSHVETSLASDGTFFPQRPFSPACQQNVRKLRLMAQRCGAGEKSAPLVGPTGINRLQPGAMPCSPRSRHP